MNRKRVQRIWREGGLRVPVRKRQRLGDPTVPAERLRAERRPATGRSLIPESMMLIPRAASALRRQPSAQRLATARRTTGSSC